MSNKFSRAVLCFTLSVVFGFISSGYSQAPRLPETLEEQIDVLAVAVADGVDVQEPLVRIGPSAVPIISQKLQKSLAEGSSPQGAQAFAMLDMPEADQKRANYQLGLVILQGTALREMSLEPTIKAAALSALYSVLKSPYMIARKGALYATANGGDASAIDEVILLLDDRDKSNRVVAAEVLGKIGDASTAEKIKVVLEKRRRGLTAEEVEMDWSFRHGFEAIKQIESKGASASTLPRSQLIGESFQPLTTTPSVTDQTASAHEISHTVTAKSSFRSFPILSVAILVAVIAVVFAIVRRRKDS